MALGVSLLPAAPAAAHNSLTGSDPRDGARIAQSPARIELRFLAKPDPATTKITVTGPDNVAALGGAASFSGSRVSVPFKPGRAGLYIVGYQVASTDGHPVSGEIRFTLTTGTPADPASSSTATAAAVPSSTALTPAATGPTGGSPTMAAAPAAGASDDAGRGWLWPLGGLVLLAVLGGALLLRRRTARR